VAELAPDSCRGVERAVPFLTATEGLGRRVVLETVDSAVTGCAPFTVLNTSDWAVTGPACSAVAAGCTPLMSAPAETQLPELRT